MIPGTPCASLYFLWELTRRNGRRESTRRCSTPRPSVRRLLELHPSHEGRGRSLSARTGRSWGRCCHALPLRSSILPRRARSGIELLRLLQPGQRDGPTTPSLGNGSRGHVSGGEGVHRSPPEEAFAASLPPLLPAVDRLPGLRCRHAGDRGEGGRCPHGDRHDQPCVGRQLRHCGPGVVPTGTSCPWLSSSRPGALR